MNDRKLLKTGIIGTLTMGVCCFTPLLVVLFGVLGLSAWLAWADFVLLPALGVFVCLAIVAAIRLRRGET